MTGGRNLEMHIDETTIDWSELRLQKNSLLNTISLLENEQLFKTAESLRGILRFIDKVQAAAVDSGGVSAEEVF